ncbi:MAG: N,N'-diacetylchitobiose phosphorylase [Lachnospiraceae bacterium]|nr:N,N'-diacetylchitobiose phosphorylase [Lachnospiraceae bacterium]
MNYGFFDDKKREYVITRPDTPAPWANYLGSPEYGALISNNAGGYSFAKSGANGRILRYVFNSFDRPGRYIYLRDDETNDYWSQSWQPVGKSLDTYKTTCRHGLGYTIMETEYYGIESEASYYVPFGKTYEVWALKVTNKSDKTRNLTVTGYAEFTNHSNYEQDQVNLQYSLFISRTEFEKNRICQKLHGNLDAIPKEEQVDGKIVTKRFFGLAGNSVDSYCGDKESFIGNYHDYKDPVGVINGDLGNALSYNENSCGALSTKLTIAPGESKYIAFVLGEKSSEEAEDIMNSYGNLSDRVAAELSALRSYWDNYLSRFVVKTPSKEFDTMINTWNAYNCFMTFIWSRAASFTYCGLRNGYGYRDTVQDIQGVIHLAPEMAKEKIRFMLSAQVDNGGGLPLVKFTHNAGHEDTPDDASYVKETGHPAYRADDALWLFPTVYKYISETGDVAFLDEVIPFANKDEGTVYEHLKRAIGFTQSHLGPHGMPAGLYADWNDCLRLGKDGESSFVAFQYYYALNIIKKFAEEKNDAEYIEALSGDIESNHKLINDLCWNEDRFIRGFTEVGELVGYRNDSEANIWLNPQSWAIISGLADENQSKTILDVVNDRLNSDYGLMLMDPPYHANAFPGALAVIYNAGVKENSGIFSQSQGWIILAEALAGHGDRAFTYFLENAPSAQNDQAEKRVLEPYCYGQFTEGKASPHFGRSHVHWLTGTASTMMVGCVEGILGMRPDLKGIAINPSIPSAWDEVTIEKVFRGKKLNITIKNPEHHESGVKSLVLNGKTIDGNYISEDLLNEENKIIANM